MSFCSFFQLCDPGQQRLVFVPLSIVEIFDMAEVGAWLSAAGCHVQQVDVLVAKFWNLPCFGITGNLQLVQLGLILLKFLFHLNKNMLLKKKKQEKAVISQNVSSLMTEEKRRKLREGKVDWGDMASYAF